MPHCRVAIIGSGVIGAAVAETLAARGAAVSLFDMRAPGRGASQASAGVLSPYIEATPGSALLTLGTHSLSMWDGWVDALRARTPERFHYARTGTLELAIRDSEVMHLRESAVWLSQAGVAHEWLEGDALRAREPSGGPTVSAGLFITGHGHVDVPALVQALMHSARLHGATCQTPTEIVHVEQKRDVVHVRVGDSASTATMEFDHVVVAAGSWSRRVRVAGAPAFPVRPIRGQLLKLGWPGDTPLPTCSVWGTRCYTVPWPDGSLLVGATVEDVGFDERSTVEGVRGLLDAVCELLPAAAQASVDQVLVGLRPATADHLPLLGALPGHSRVILAAGHYRNGILLAPYTADVVSRLLLDNDRDPRLDLTRVDRPGLV